MIITRTPIRIEFLGGGTDIDYFYKKHMGRVLNAAIDKYIYISISKPFDKKMKIRYSVNEVAKSVAAIKHTRVKATLEYLEIKDLLEITSTADIPAKGTGLGSSSSFTVGLIHALLRYKKSEIDPRKIAEDACHVEIDLLKEPIGKQDQYAAALGGLNLMSFSKSGRVTVRKVDLSKMVSAKFEDYLLLVYTGKTRSNKKILDIQKQNLDKKVPHLLKMAELAADGAEALRKSNLRDFAEILEEEWTIKKNIAPITNAHIEKMYQKTKDLGAWGGRISGAGGGGFLVLIVPPDKQKRIINHFGKDNIIKPRFVSEGTELICDENSWR